MREAAEVESGVHSAVLAVFNAEYAKKRYRALQRQVDRVTPRQPVDLRSVASAMAQDFPGSVTRREDH